MGFYDDKTSSSTGWKKSMALVALSAFVGSASTFAMMKSSPISATQPISTQQMSSKAASSTPVPVSNVSVNVNGGIVEAVKKVKPAIVGIVNYGTTSSDPFNQGSAIQEQGEGSGIVFDKEGYIVTNNHVVEGASKVEVLLPNEKKAQATVVGTDPYSDLAVLKIPSTYITTVATLGDSAKLQVGEPAIAIGNPLGQEFNQTVTTGVISATQRMMPVTDEQSGQTLNQQAVLQTDAAINPGNSGGALCNVEGQVIGINSSKIAKSGVEGMGFAIPINEARQIIDRIVKSGHVDYPALGISVSDVQQNANEQNLNLPVAQGVLITQVQSLEAKRGGLQRGDVITAMNGVKITGSFSLHSELFKQKIGDTVTLTVYRSNGKEQTLSVKLTSLSAAASSGDNSNTILP
jgi:serine protease Do